MNGGKYRWFASTIGLAILALDQLTKWLLLVQWLSPERPMIEVTSFFDVVLVWNTGISFGLFSAAHEPLLLTAVSGVVVAVLLVWLMRNNSRLVAVALGCVIGGAAGNVIDRLRFGAVTDFLDFHLGHYHWPAFNIADSSIFIGVVLLCISSMLATHTKS